MNVCLVLRNSPSELSKYLTFTLPQQAKEQTVKYAYRIGPKIDSISLSTAEKAKVPILSLGNCIVQMSVNFLIIHFGMATCLLKMLIIP